MTVFSLRRAVLGLACASAVLLAACGSSSVESQLVPTRIIGFGDAFNVVTPGASYTVNDSTSGVITTWIVQLASSYGMTLNPSLIYAQGNARITNTTDAAGGSNTPISVQIDNFLASNTLGANDLVVINGGISDIVADMAAVTAGTMNGTQFLTNATQYGKDLSAQAHRLVAAGSKHVVIVGAYNLSRSPWAAALGQSQSVLLQGASTNFNVALLSALNNLSGSPLPALYIDAPYFFNVLASSDYARFGGPSNYTSLACASLDSGAGIGTGNGQVNSSICGPSTLNPAIVANSAGVTYDQYLFADRLYFTPIAQRLFGVYTYGKIRALW